MTTLGATHYFAGTIPALLLVLAGCRGEVDSTPQPSSISGSQRAGHILAFENGRVEHLSEDAVSARGLTIIDLSEEWVPFVFSDRDRSGEPPIHNRAGSLYIDLARGRSPEAPTMAQARKIVRSATPKEHPRRSQEQYLEVFGISPSLNMLRRRAIEEISRPCFGQVDFEKIRRFKGMIAYQDNQSARAYAETGAEFSMRLAAKMERNRTHNPTLFLRVADDRHKSAIQRAIAHDALVEIQKQLACEGLLTSAHIPGGLDWETHHALLAFEQKNRIFGWGNLGGDTLEALKKKPNERLFDAFKRVLEERIVDATGIIEDGSLPSNPRSWGYLDTDGNHHPLPNLVARFTEVALDQLHVGSSKDAVAFLQNFSEHELAELKVAIRLPDVPPYYGDVMHLSAEIDRGDVWYEYPYTPRGLRRGQPRKQMPRLTLYTTWHGQKIPLVSMITTIGSWQNELAPDGYEYLKYKNSTPGLQYWKQIVAGPVWLPPPTTPPKEIIKDVTYRGHRVRVVDYNQIGPWYKSAYGLVAAIHLTSGEDEGSARIDNGIRSHGSHDYTSLQHRYSHGCHRLYNHLAIRLFSFILRHAAFKRVGHIEETSRVTFEIDDREYTISVNDRGYYYHLHEPIPVHVLEGRILGDRQNPIERYMPKPGAEYGPDATALLE